MPDITQDKAALDYLVQNPNDPNANAIMNKLKAEPIDIEAYKYGLENNDVKVKNKVYDRLASRRPALQEMPKDFASDRMVIKNLIATEPDLQKKYLEKKGYQVRVAGENLEVKRPGETRWGVIDPEGIDRWDFTDVMGDVAEAVVSGFATGAKAIGAVTGGIAGGTAGGGVGAIPGSLVGFGVGSAVGGAAGAGLETIKQYIGKALGAREEISGREIAKSGVVGAVIPAGLKIIGKGVSTVGKGLASGLRGTFGIKSKAGKVIEAASELGAKPTPSQLYDSPLIARTEASLLRTPGTIGGMGLRKQVAGNIKATQAAADDIVKEASSKTAFEVGKNAERKILSELSEKIKPAEDIYNKYEAQFRNIRPTLKSFKDILSPKGSERFSDTSKKIIKDAQKNLFQVKNLDDLKQFRTSLGKKMTTAKKQGDDEAIGVLGRLYEEASKVRSETLLKQAKLQGNEFFNVAKKEIDQADAIWRSSVKETENALLGGGKQIKRGLMASTKEFFEKIPEGKRIRKIIDTGDPKRIEKIKTDFPKAFNELRTGIIQEIKDKSERLGEIDPVKLTGQLKKLPAETRALLFGKDSDLKFKALNTYLDSISTRGIKTSGTAENMLFDQATSLMSLKGIMTQIGSMSRSVLLDTMANSGAKKNFLTKLGKAIQTPTAKGLGVFTTREKVINERDQKIKGGF